MDTKLLSSDELITLLKRQGNYLIVDVEGKEEDLIHTVKEILRMPFKPGYVYSKSGIDLYDIHMRRNI